MNWYGKVHSFYTKQNQANLEKDIETLLEEKFNEAEYDKIINPPHENPLLLLE